MNRGYQPGTGPHFRNALQTETFRSSQDTLSDVKKNYTQWGRTASVPNGALRGHVATSMPPPAAAPSMISRWSSDTDTVNTSFDTTASSLNLKRGMAEEDSDAILAGAFEDDDGDNAPPMLDDAWATRPVRPLPARQGLRPTMSMPPMHSLDHMQVAMPGPTVEMEEATEGAEPFRRIDFSSFASQTDGF